MYKYILFDLDGTLLNTYKGVSNGVRYTLEYYGLPIPEEKEMRKTAIENAKKKYRFDYEKI